MQTVRAIAALMMALGVAGGAFGAHALRDHLDAYSMAIWEKAVLYHLVHALGALAVTALVPQALAEGTATKVSWLLLLSILVFSGSLYILVLSGQKWLGMITPIGGSGFIFAWIWLAWAMFRRQ